MGASFRCQPRKLAPMGRSYPERADTQIINI